jgi:hypothetical protein
MVYKSDKNLNACSRLDKLGFSVSDVSLSFDKKPSCYVYLGDGSVKVEVPDDNTPMTNIVDLMVSDLIDATHDLDRKVNKRIDWDEVKEKGW